MIKHQPIKSKTNLSLLSSSTSIQDLMRLLVDQRLQEDQKLLEDQRLQEEQKLLEVQPLPEV